MHKIFKVNYSDTAQSSLSHCATYIRFLPSRLLSDLSAVDEVAGMDAKVFAICDNCGRKVKSSWFDKTFAKLELVLP